MQKKTSIIFYLILLSFTLNVHAQGFAPASNDSIDFPEDVKRNYDELLTEWSRNLDYYDNCTSLSDDYLFCEDSIYIERLYALPTTMELVYNPSVKRYIEMYIKGRRQVALMLGKGAYYFPMFEEELDKHEMPLELKYLPIIESALNPIAKSRVGATGLWQFMAGTGRMYNLEINSLVDERRDPEKSTQAAVRYMKHLYAIFNDWNLVIAAYNCGEGNVNKAITRSGGRTDFWDIYPYLPRETRNYVPLFIAATYIMNYYDKHNICPAQSPFPPAMDTIIVNQNIHFQQISDIIQISVDELKEYNPQFLANIIPGNHKGYTLNMPIRKISEYITKEHTIQNHRAAELLTHRKLAGLDVVGGGPLGSKLLTYSAKKGEKLDNIAKQHGVTVNQLKAWNNISANSLSSNRSLKIYTGNTSTQSVEIEEKSTLAIIRPESPEEAYLGVRRQIKKYQMATVYHKIQRGESLGVIAKKQGVSVANLKAWNNLKSNNLTAGNQLKIQKNTLVETEEFERFPEPEPNLTAFDSSYAIAILDEYLVKIESERPSISLDLPFSSEYDESSADMTETITQAIYHKVRPGETMRDIATRYNISVKDITEWNDLKVAKIKPGQRLTLHIPKNSNENQAEEPYDEVRERIILT